jgi:hypothetical protein
MPNLQIRCCPAVPMSPVLWILNCGSIWTPGEEAQTGILKQQGQRVYFLRCEGWEDRTG